METREILLAIAGGSLIIVGAYIMAKPRRLFMMEEDRAEYRPATVPIDSPQGQWLIKAAPAYVVVGLVLIGVAFL